MEPFPVRRARPPSLTDRNDCTATTICQATVRCTSDAQRAIPCTSRQHEVVLTGRRALTLSSDLKTLGDKSLGKSSLRLAPLSRLGGYASPVYTTPERSAAKLTGQGS